MSVNTITVTICQILGVPNPPSHIPPKDQTLFLLATNPDWWVKAGLHVDVVPILTSIAQKNLDEYIKTINVLFTMPVSERMHFLLNFQSTSPKIKNSDEEDIEKLYNHIITKLGLKENVVTPASAKEKLILLLSTPMWLDKLGIPDNSRNVLKMLSSTDSDGKTLETLFTIVGLLCSVNTVQKRVEIIDTLNAQPTCLTLSEKFNSALPNILLLVN